MVEIASAYCDGGLATKNPSSVGGTWAWCHVSPYGARLDYASGFITPTQAGLRSITNNLSELLAAVECLESLSEGWGGTLHTDSDVTRLRVSRSKQQARLEGIPLWLRDRLRHAKIRCDNYKVVLLGGHPSKADLNRGHHEDGLLVSLHNVWCDAECKRRAAELLAIAQRVKEA